MNKNYFYDYFDKSADILLREYERSKLQKSGTDLGSNRELFLNEFLNKILPQRLSVRSGEVIDHTGFSTGQLDTIIIRDDTPCLNFGGQNTYIAGGVFAVLEIKSKLTKSKLEESIKCLKNVSKLNFPMIQILIGMDQTPFKILRIIVAYKGSSLASIASNLFSQNCQDVDLICIIDQGVIIRKELMINLYDGFNEYKEENENYISINTKASSLAFLFAILSEFGPTLLVGSSSVENYFLNIKNKWN